jgi:hypothetical protein
MERPAWLADVHDRYLVRACLTTRRTARRFAEIGAHPAAVAQEWYWARIYRAELNRRRAARRAARRQEEADPPPVEVRVVRRGRWYDVVDAKRRVLARWANQRRAEADAERFRRAAGQVAPGLDGGHPLHAGSDLRPHRGLSERVPEPEPRPGTVGGGDSQPGQAR